MQWYSFKKQKQKHHWRSSNRRREEEDLEYQTQLLPVVPVREKDVFWCFKNVCLTFLQLFPSELFSHGTPFGEEVCNKQWG